LEVVYDSRHRTDIPKCIITEETIRSGRLPLLLTKTEIDKGVDETNYQEWLAAPGASASVPRDRRATLPPSRRGPGRVAPERPRSERGMVRAARARRRESRSRGVTGDARYRVTRGGG